jgi:hypothetical protein
MLVKFAVFSTYAGFAPCKLEFLKDTGV